MSTSASTAADAPAPRFNPRPRLSVVPAHEGAVCVVLDDVLLNAEEVRAWACRQPLMPPEGYPYPGRVAPVEAAIARPLEEHFNQHVRARLGARRTLGLTARVSLVTTAPAQLSPVQWLCHRDRIAAHPQEVLFAASVLYLFEDARLGGTSLYRPRRSSLETDRLVYDSQTLPAEAFASRYGLQPGYMTEGNDWFERTARVDAAFNRAVYYDGSIFHSADVLEPQRLSEDPRTGRLSVNGFYTCKRRAS
ncbi:MAG: DUF6445 family protein [Limnohabitans sp.]